MNYCPNCGLKLPQSIDAKGTPPKFCPGCGYSLAVVPAVAPGVQANGTRSLPLSYGLFPAVALGALGHHGDASFDGAGMADGSMGDFGSWGDFGGMGGFDMGGFGDC